MFVLVWHHFSVDRSLCMVLPPPPPLGLHPSASFIPSASLCLSLCPISSFPCAVFGLTVFKLVFQSPAHPPWCVWLFLFHPSPHSAPDERNPAVLCFPASRLLFVFFMSAPACRLEFWEYIKVREGGLNNTSSSSFLPVTLGLSWLRDSGGFKPSP